MRAMVYILTIHFMRIFNNVFLQTDILDYMRRENGF